MISSSELRKIARARLKDAEALHAARRYGGGAYICGYAIELALKARICRALKWTGFPETQSEFRELLSFKTHSLDVLLRLSGREQKVKTERLSEWSAVSTWTPSSRYQAVGTATGGDLQLMIQSAKALMRVI